MLEKLKYNFQYFNYIMNEKTMVLIITVISLGIGILTLAYLLFGNYISAWVIPYFEPVYVKEYDANLIIDNNIYLYEYYAWHINLSNKYRMLYRNFSNADLYLYNEHIAINKGYHLLYAGTNTNYKIYVVLWNGKIYERIGKNKFLPSLDSRLFQLVKKYSIRNEVGIFNPNYYEKGDYDLGLKWLVVPVIYSDSNYYFINLKLADKHIPYTNVNIKVYDPKNAIVDLQVFEGLNVVKKDGYYLITGVSPTNGLIEIHIILDKSKLNFLNTTKINSIFDEHNKNLWQYFLKKLGIFLLPILCILFSISMYIVYNKFGAEKFAVVPKYLHFVPNENRKPWEVNYFFVNEEKFIDLNGFYATLLNLHNKGIIRIKDGRKIEIVGKHNKHLDSYELKVIHFLKRYSDNNVFDIDKLKSKIHAEKDLAKSVYYKLEDLTYGYSSRKSFLDFTGDTIKYILCLFFVPVCIVILWLFGYVDFNTFISNVFAWFILAWIFTHTICFYVEQGLSRILKNDRIVKAISKITYIVLYLFSLWVVSSNVNNILLFICGTITLLYLLLPSRVFGHWKKDYYKEYLQWNAFKNFLRDLAKIHKEEFVDLSKWKDWLIYGVALGVGDKVVEYLKNLGVIEFDELDAYLDLTNAFSDTYYYARNVALSADSSSSSFGGFDIGGFSVGSGFGGGGAGAR